MSSSTGKSFLGGALTIIGYALAPAGIGYALIAVGAALSYSGGRQAAKEAAKEQERRAREALSNQVIKGNVSGGAEVHHLVFGEHRIGGIRCAFGQPLLFSRVLHWGIAHSLAHPGGCEGITGIWLDDTEFKPDQWSGADPIAAEVSLTNAKYVAGIYLVKFKHYRGTGTQVADAQMITDGVTLTTDYRRGIAWTRFTLTRPSDANYEEQFREAFPSGIPNLGVTLRGLRCYDPRLDSTNGGSGSHRYNDPLTWAWTRNSALCGATYMIMERSDGGMGRAPTAINWASVAASANICDEDVIVQSGTYVRTGTTITVTIANHGWKAGHTVRLDFTSGGGSDATYTVVGASANTFTVTDAVSGSTSGNVNVIEDRYLCDIALSTSESDELNLRAILRTMWGECIPVDGVYKFYAGAYRSPTFTLDESWLRGDVTIRTRFPLEGLYNAVRVIHADARQKFETVEAPAYTNPTYEAEDGGERLWREEVLEGVASTFQAQRIGTILGLRSRGQRIIEVPCNLKALNVECWENGTVTLADVGLAGAVHRVVDWTWDGDGPVLILQQEDSAYYSGAAYANPIVYEPPAVVVETPPAPGGVSAFLGIDGIDVRWATPLSTEVARIKVYRATAIGGPYTAIASAIGYSYHDPITVAGTYYYKLTSINRYGDESADSAIVNATVPSSFDVVNLKLANQAGSTFNGRDVQLEWDNGQPPAHVRFRDYRVRIFDPADASVMRTIYTAHPKFVYTYEMNLQDSIAEGYSSPRRTLNVEVVQNSIEGVLSTNPALLTPTNPAPSAVTVTLAPSFDGVEVYFTKPTDPDLLGVRVYVSTSSGFTPNSGNLQYDGPHQYPIFVSGLNQSTTYYVKVIAYDVFGDGATSTETSTTTTATPAGDTTAPTTPNSAAAPTVTSIVRTNKLFAEGELKVAWSASTDASGRWFYRIEYWTSDTTKKQVVETENLTVAIYPAEINVLYSVRVQAIDYSGNASAFTPTATHTISVDVTAPAAPTSPVATAMFDGVLVRWVNPTDADFLQAKVHRSTSSGFTPDGSNLIAETRADAFVDANVVNGTTYYYKVIARDVQGNLSSASAQVSAVPFTISSANVGGFMADGAVLTAKLGDLQVTLGKLAANSVDTSKLVNDAVTNVKLANAAVEEAKIAAGAVTTAKVADLNITLGKLAANSVDAAKLVDNAVTAVKIADSAVTAAKLNVFMGGGNLLPNSSFEVDSDSNGTADYWSVYAAADTLTRVTSAVKHGTYAQQALTTGASTPRLHLIDRRPKLISGQAYVLTAYVAAASGQTLYLGYKTFTATTAGSEAAQGTSVTVAAVDANTPVRLTLKFTAPDANYLSPMVGLNGTPADNTVFIIDAVQLEDGDVATAYAPKPDEILPSTITATEIADNAVTTNKLIANAVTAAKIAANTITAAQIAAGTITATEIAAATITGAKIAAGTITASNIQANTLTANEIAANAITSSELAANAVIAGKIAAGVVTANEIAALTITAAQIAAATITGGKIAAGTITATNIQALTITAAEIAAGTITAAKIAADTITSNEIAANAITVNELAANAVTAAKIAANTITAAQIAAGTITATEIAALTVTAAQIAANTITAAKIAADTITANEIAANAITSNELAANSVVAGKIAANSIDASHINAQTLTGATIQTDDTGQRFVVDKDTNEAHFHGARGGTMSGTYSQTGTTITCTITGHGLTTGDYATLDFTTGTADDGSYVVTVTGVDTFTVTSPSSESTSGNVSLTTAVIQVATIGINGGIQDDVIGLFGATSSQKSAINALGASKYLVESKNSSADVDAAAVRGESTASGAGLSGKGYRVGAALNVGTDGFMKAEPLATAVRPTVTPADTALAHIAFNTQGELFARGMNSGAQWNLINGPKVWLNFKGTQQTGTYSRDGSGTITVTITAHGVATGERVQLDFTTGTATDGSFIATSTGANTFTVAQAGASTSGNVTLQTQVRDSYNVSSVADNGTGDFTINFTTALLNASYAPVGWARDATNARPTISGSTTTAQTTSALRVMCDSGANAAADHHTACIAIFGSEIPASFVPFTQTFTGTGAGTTTVPSGATSITFKVWGNGGKGGSGFNSGGGGGGGGGGGYSERTVVLTSADWGKTVNYDAPVTNTAGNGETASLSVNLVNNNTSMSANGGVVGAAGVSGAGGAGGTASGGTTNTTGTTGGTASGDDSGAGGAGAGSGGAGGPSVAAAFPGIAGSAPGGGGSGGGGTGGTQPGGNGGAARVQMAWS